MNIKKRIEEQVSHCYRKEHVNCAATILKVLEDHFHTKLQDQVLEAAIGMHGAGRYGAQCGLVEGSLMFIGIHGSEKGWEKDRSISICCRFAAAFEKKFGSLSCSSLRPDGFNDSQPPHLCMDLTQEAAEFTIDCLKQNS